MRWVMGRSAVFEHYMMKRDIPCFVSSNTTVIKNKGQFIKENGCQIKMGSHDSSTINTNFWIGLKNTFGLNCAHLEVEGKFKGCIYDYFRKRKLRKHQSKQTR